MQLRSWNDKDLGAVYPSILAAGLKVRATQAVVDGELVAVDAVR